MSCLYGLFSSFELEKQPLPTVQHSQSKRTEEQYQKRLRLHAARDRMLMEGLDAASAAFEVGYESASQFNREYKRFFGQPPMRDIKSRRLVESAATRG
jgi:AraC-like DNA-binding protein